MKATARPSLLVSADGRGVVSHAGSRLLADLADRTTLTAEVSAALAGLARPRALHQPGRVLLDLAVAVADGAECISDIAVLADQPGLFGAVASNSTVWRLLDQLDAPQLAAVAAARAAARQVVWAQRAELVGAAVPAARAAGQVLPGLVIDLDASIVVAHSEKESAAPTFKHTFGYHPLLAFCDNSGEFLAGMLRPGNAGANTAADHVTVPGLGRRQGFVMNRRPSSTDGLQQFHDPSKCRAAYAVASAARCVERRSLGWGCRRGMAPSPTGQVLAASWLGGRSLSAGSFAHLPVQTRT